MTMIGLSRVLCGIPEGMLMAPELNMIGGPPDHEEGKAPDADDLAAQRERITMVEFMLFNEERQVVTPLRVFLCPAREEIREDELLVHARARLADALERAARALRQP